MKTQSVLLVSKEMLHSGLKVLIGVRQWCLLSPTLFNIFLEFAVKEIQCLHGTVKLDKDLTCDVRYADDTDSSFIRKSPNSNWLGSVYNKFGLKKMPGHVIRNRWNNNR